LGYFGIYIYNKRKYRFYVTERESMIYNRNWTQQIENFKWDITIAFLRRHFYSLKNSCIITSVFVSRFRYSGRYFVFTSSLERVNDKSIYTALEEEWMHRKSNQELRRMGELAYFRFAYSHHPARAAFSRSSTYLAIHQYSRQSKNGSRFAYRTPRLHRFFFRTDLSGTSRSRSWERSCAKYIPRTPFKTSYVSINSWRKWTQWTHDIEN